MAELPKVKQMTHLQSLKVVTSKRPTQISEIQYRRNKVIKKLFEQLECAKAIAEGRECLFKRFRTLKNKETGARIEVEHHYRIKPWWYVNDEGKTIFELRYGSRSIEITKGKTGIEVASIDKLVETLITLKLAVESGELDEGIKQLFVHYGKKAK